MKMVLQTQFKENYGAHDWDGEGACPQYWKCKGGDTYILDISVRQGQDDAFIKHILDHIEYKSDFSEEYVLGWDFVDDIDFEESNHVEDWESPIYLEHTHIGFAAKQYRKTDFNHELVVGRLETYNLVDGKRTDFLLQIDLKDGRRVDYRDFTKMQEAA
jgi:hypothetical protein